MSEKKISLLSYKLGMEDTLCADSNICMLTKKQVKRLPDGVIGIFY
jgi:hypothetical protein